MGCQTMVPKRTVSSTFGIPPSTPYALLPVSHASPGKREPPRWLHTSPRLRSSVQDPIYFPVASATHHLSPRTRPRAYITGPMYLLSGPACLFASFTRKGGGKRSKKQEAGGENATGGGENNQDHPNSLSTKKNVKNITCPRTRRRGRPRPDRRLVSPWPSPAPAPAPPEHSSARGGAGSWGSA